MTRYYQHQTMVPPQQKEPQRETEQLGLFDGSSRYLRVF